MENSSVDLIQNTSDATRLAEIEIDALGRFFPLYKDCLNWPTTPSQEYVVSINQQNAIGVWTNNVLIGFIIFERKHQNHWYLVEIDIITAYQGQGFGKLLIRYFLDLAIKNNIKDIYLRTFVTAPWSMYLYKKFGFREVIQWPNYIDSIIETEQQLGLPVVDRITLLKEINLYENFILSRSG